MQNNVTYLYYLNEPVKAPEQKKSIFNWTSFVAGFLIVGMLSCATAPITESGRVLKYRQNQAPTTQGSVFKTMTPEKEIEARKILDQTYLQKSQTAKIQFSPMSPRLREFVPDAPPISDAKEEEARIELARKMEELDILAQEQDILKSAARGSDWEIVTKAIAPQKVEKPKNGLFYYYLLVAFAVVSYLFRKTLTPFVKALYRQVRRLALRLWVLVSRSRNPFVLLALSYESFDPMI